jgi:hypothetical protein
LSLSVSRLPLSSSAKADDPVATRVDAIGLVETAIAFAITGRRLRVHDAHAVPAGRLPQVTHFPIKAPLSSITVAKARAGFETRMKDRAATGERARDVLRSA